VQPGGASIDSMRATHAKNESQQKHFELSSHEPGIEANCTLQLPNFPYELLVQIVLLTDPPAYNWRITCPLSRPRQELYAFTVTCCRLLPLRHAVLKVDPPANLLEDYGGRAASFEMTSPALAFDIRTPPVWLTASPTSHHIIAELQTLEPRLGLPDPPPVHVDQRHSPASTSAIRGARRIP
jgi:hypothetical protein